jgi:pilus assembly protein Flp/PilA
MTITNKLARDQRGAGTIEYSLVAALIAVAAIGGYQSLGDWVKGTFNNVGDKVETSL